MDKKEILTAFEEQGYVILKGLLPPEVVQGVQRDLELWVEGQAQHLRQEGYLEADFADAPFEQRLLRLYEDCLAQAPQIIRQELHWPGMYGLFFYPPLLDLVEQILGPEVRLYPNYSVRPKFPEHAPTEVLWHQDAAYTASGMHGRDPAGRDLEARALRMVNVWTPLVPARVENGCMEFVAGSHKGEIVEHHKRQHYLEIEAAQIEARRDQAVVIECDPGDVVLFSNMIFHRGLPNRAAMIRWSCDWRYQNASQSTLRRERGHIARSRAEPDRAVHSAEEWVQLSFV